MLKLWLVPKSFPLKAVTNQEQNWSLELSSFKRREYLHARGYIRYILGDLLNENPLDIKLNAPPNKPPNLDFGVDNHISISHCVDYLFFGYSSSLFGLDIERTDRNFLYKNVSNRFYTESEKKYLKRFETNEYRKETLKLWVAKEAAIKCNRGKLYKEIKNWEFNFESKIIFNKKFKTKLDLNIFEFKNWFLSIASKEAYTPSELTICLYENS